MTRRSRSATAKSAGKVKILVADNQAILVDGVRLLLEKQRNFKVVHAAADGADAVHLVKQSRPDVAILSIEMSGLNGIEAAHQIRAVSPSTRVLILSRHASPDFACQALRAGADTSSRNAAAGKKSWRPCSRSLAARATYARGPLSC